MGITSYVKLARKSRYSLVDQVGVPMVKGEYLLSFRWEQTAQVWEHVYKCGQCLDELRKVIISCMSLYVERNCTMHR